MELDHAADDGTVHLTINRHSSIRLKSLAAGGSKTAARGDTECRSVSPTASEEEIMTYNGIMRTTELRVQFDRESSLAAGGGGDADVSSRASSDLKGKVSRGSL